MTSPTPAPMSTATENTPLRSERLPAPDGARAAQAAWLERELGRDEQPRAVQAAWLDGEMDRQSGDGSFSDEPTQAGWREAEQAMQGGGEA